MKTSIDASDMANQRIILQRQSIEKGLLPLARAHHSFGNLSWKTEVFRRLTRNGCGPPRPLPLGGIALAISRVERGDQRPPQQLELDMWQTLKETFKEWTEDKVPRLSAALAFYTMLSIAPLLIITTKVVGMFVGRKGLNQKV